MTATPLLVYNMMCHVIKSVFLLRMLYIVTAVTDIINSSTTGYFSAHSVVLQMYLGGNPLLLQLHPRFIVLQGLHQDNRIHQLVLDNELIRIFYN